MDQKKVMEKVLSLNFNENEIRGRTSSSLTIAKCPYCGRLWKLNVNMEKGVFRCPACDEAGNAVKLHAKLNSLSYKEALQALKDEHIKPVKIFKISSQKNMKIASIERRNEVYASIISHGICSMEQYEDLKKRGLPEDFHRWYVTMIDGMNDSVSTWCRDLRNVLLAEKEIVGIPGIYGEIKRDESNHEITNELHLNLPKFSGYLIPVISHYQGEPLISCCQIRHFKGKQRYSFFTSSGLKNGTSVSGCNKVHYTRNFWNEKGEMIIPKTVNLTEGALKADVASVLSDRQFIAILGVNDTKDLENELKFLKSHGCQNINICFDMDYQNNPNVAKALKKVQEIINSTGLNPKTIKWDKQYKGIDDFFLAQKEGGNHEQ